MPFCYSVPIYHHRGCSQQYFPGPSGGHLRAEVEALLARPEDLCARAFEERGHEGFLTRPVVHEQGELREGDAERAPAQVSARGPEHAVLPAARQHQTLPAPPQRYQARRTVVAATSSICNGPSPPSQKPFQNYVVHLSWGSLATIQIHTHHVFAKLANSRWLLFVSLREHVIFAGLVTLIHQTSLLERERLIARGAISDSKIICLHRVSAT